MNEVFDPTNDPFFYYALWQDALAAQPKGRCRDCLFLIQEWHLQWKKHQGALQEYMELDQYCQLCDIFKPLDGYCDCWEPK